MSRPLCQMTYYAACPPRDGDDAERCAGGLPRPAGRFDGDADGARVAEFAGQDPRGPSTGAGQ